jgi:hypothetical protein
VPLADLDGDGAITGDPDLALARQALEVARREGQEFGPSFDGIVAFFGEREATAYTARYEREHLVRALSDLRDVWRAAFENRPDPESPRASRLKTVPLDLRQLRRILDKPRRPKRKKPCRICGRSWLPSYGHELTCSPECSRQLRRRRESAEARRARRARRAQTPLPV